MGYLIEYKEKTSPLYRADISAGLVRGTDPSFSRRLFSNLVQGRCFLDMQSGRVVQPPLFLGELSGDAVQTSGFLDTWLADVVQPPGFLGVRLTGSVQSLAFLGATIGCSRW